MMPNLRKRLHVIEGLVDASEMSADKIRSAMRAWTERGELPTNPRMREYIIHLYATLDAMRATVPGWNEPAPTSA